MGPQHDEDQFRQEVVGETQEGGNESSIEMQGVDPAFAEQVMADVAAAKNSGEKTPEEQSQIEQLEQRLTTESQDRAYTESEEQRRQENIAYLKEAYQNRLASSPRYQELYAQYSKPTIFIEGTNRVKEQAPDPSFGKPLHVEGVEAPNFPEAKIIQYEKNGQTERYALRRNQYGELQGNQFTVREKRTDPNSRAVRWEDSPVATASVSTDPERYMIGPTYQMREDSLEEMEAYLKANDISI